VRFSKEKVEAEGEEFPGREWGLLCVVYMACTATLWLVYSLGRIPLW
jgi:hypothetical protein